MINNNSPKNTVIGITGITGTLGSRLAEIMQQRGFTVVGLIRPERLSQLQVKLDYRIIEGAITDVDSVKQLVSEVDVVIHLAAHVGHADKKQYHAVNVEGVHNICKAISTYKPSCRLINCSSIAALRIPRLAPFIASNYARSKAEADRVVNKFQKYHQLKTATIYPGLIYGPGDTKFLPKVIENLKKGGLFYVSGGEKNAPLIYIDDLCELFYLAALQPKLEGQHYIGISDDPIGIHSFFNEIARRIGANTPSRVIPKSLILPLAILLEIVYQTIGAPKMPPLSRRIIDILSINFARHSVNANQELGWKPQVSPEKGLDAFFNWWKIHKE